MSQGTHQPSQNRAPDVKEVNVTDFKRTNYHELVASGLIDSLEQELQHMYEWFEPLFDPSDEPTDTALILYINTVPAACIALKEYHGVNPPEISASITSETLQAKGQLRIAEVIRVFVAPQFRGRRNGNIVSTMMAALQTWAIELGFHALILKTADLQKRAIDVYTRNNYKIIALYEEPYPKGETICFGLVL